MRSICNREHTEKNDEKEKAPSFHNIEYIQCDELLFK
jgi:hypothetical protein